MNPQRSKKGVALATVLIMVIGIAGLGLALHYFGRAKVADVLSRSHKMQTNYLAFTGLSDGLFYFNDSGGDKNWYSNGSVTYQVHTSTLGESRKAGEYRIDTSGIVLDTAGTFVNDSRTYATGDTVNFLIWCGEADLLSSVTGAVSISDGTSSTTLSVAKTFDLSVNPGNEGFTTVYNVPGALLGTSPWYVNIWLSDGAHSYSESNITLQINGYGTPSQTGIRQVKSYGYFPQVSPLYVKSIIEGRGKMVGSSRDYKIKEIYE